MEGLNADRSACQESVNRSGNSRWPRFEPCGRSVKDEGLCGLHLAAKRRRDAKSSEWRREAQFAEETAAEAKRLSAYLGVEVKAHYSHRESRYTGEFVVSGDWLRSL